jgi:hypothetical protein
LNLNARTNPLWLALSFLIGIAFVPLYPKLPAAMEATVAGFHTSLGSFFVAAFITLFLPVLAIAAVSEERPLAISISTLAGVLFCVVVSALKMGFPGAGVLILAIFMACLLSVPAIIAGASVGSWIKTPGRMSPFDRTSLMRLLAFPIGFSFLEIFYHLPPLPFGLRGQIVASLLVLLLISMALSAYSDRRPWLTVPLMLGGIVFGVIADVSLDTKVDRNLWPIEILLMCAISAPGVIIGTAVGTTFGTRRRKRST